MYLTSYLITFRGFTGSFTEYTKKLEDSQVNGQSEPKTFLHSELKLASRQLYYSIINIHSVINCVLNIHQAVIFRCSWFKNLQLSVQITHTTISPAENHSGEIWNSSSKKISFIMLLAMFNCQKRYEKNNSKS